MADDVLIDTHVHFWDPGRAPLRWDWLTEGTGAFLPSDLEAEAADTGLGAAVHVHCADPIDDPPAETRWIDRLPDGPAAPRAIVGRCELAAVDADDVIERHVAASPLLRGVRDLIASTALAADRVGAAMDALDVRHLHVELRRPHSDIQPLIDVARRWPDTTVVLSHACLPPGRRSDDLGPWAAAMRRLASERNIVCKISAVIDDSGRGWDAAVAGPWMSEAIDAFGASRCMLGSNWPLDRTQGPYRALVDMYRAVAAGLSSSERADLFHGTASRVYAISPPAPAGC